MIFKDGIEARDHKSAYALGLITTKGPMCLLIAGVPGYQWERSFGIAEESMMPGPKMRQHAQL